MGQLCGSSDIKFCRYESRVSVNVNTKNQNGKKVISVILTVFQKPQICSDFSAKTIADLLTLPESETRAAQCLNCIHSNVNNECIFFNH